MAKSASQVGGLTGTGISSFHPPHARHVCHRPSCSSFGSGGANQNLGNYPNVGIRHGRRCHNDCTPWSAERETLATGWREAGGSDDDDESVVIQANGKVSLCIFGIADVTIERWFMLRSSFRVVGTNHIMVLLGLRSRLRSTCCPLGRAEKGGGGFYFTFYLVDWRVAEFCRFADHAGGVESV